MIFCTTVQSGLSRHQITREVCRRTAQYMIGTLLVQRCTRRTIGDNLSSAKLNLDQVMKHLQAIGNRLGETLTQS